MMMRPVQGDDDCENMNSNDMKVKKIMKIKIVLTLVMSMITGILITNDSNIVDIDGITTATTIMTMMSLPIVIIITMIMLNLK